MQPTDPNPEPTSEQLEGLRKLAQTEPYMWRPVIFLALKAGEDPEQWALHTKRKMNDLARKGYSIYQLDRSVPKAAKEPKNRNNDWHNRPDPHDATDPNFGA